MTNAKAVPPKHPNPGHCVSCGVDVPGTRWYCDDHRPARPRSIPKTQAAKAEKLTSAGAGPARSSSPRVSGKVTDDRAKATLAKLLIILTVMVSTARLRRANISDPSGQLAEELSLTNEEGTAIAGPVARWSNSTVIGARVISPIARNEDVVTAFYALYQYQRRTQVFIDAHRRGDLAPVVPIRGGAEGFDMPVTRASEQVIEPDEPIAPAEVMAQPEPIRFGDNGYMEGF